MTEPLSSTIGAVKLSTLVAGFAGGVVSLAFIKGLNRWQAATAVIVGVATAYYLTPVAAISLHIAQPDIRDGLSFLIGLLGMNIIPAVKAVFTAQNLRQLIARFLGVSTSQPTQGEGDAK